MFRNIISRKSSRNFNSGHRNCFSDLANSERITKYNKLIIACEIFVGTVFTLEILSVFSTYSLVKYPMQFERGLDDDLQYARDVVDSISGIVGNSKISDATAKRYKDYILGYYEPMVSAYKYFGFVERAKEVSLIDKFKRVKDEGLPDLKAPNDVIPQKTSNIEQDQT